MNSTKNLFDQNKTIQEQIIYYFLLYNQEKDEIKKLELLKKIERLKQGEKNA